MKWYRKPHDSSIDIYLTNKYVDKGKYEQLIKDFKEDRSNANNSDYKNLDQDFKVSVDKGFASTVWHLFLNLIIGIKEVAFYLAECFKDGFGVIKNDALADLTLAIGRKLGDQNSIDATKGKNIPNNIEALADKCLVEIRKNEADVRNRDVTWEEMVAIAKAFDYSLHKNSKLSYYYSIKPDGSGMRDCGKCIEPIIENNNPPVPPRVNNYIPPANTTIATTYHPVNDNAVKTGGKHHDHCDIL